MFEVCELNFTECLSTTNMSSAIEKMFEDLKKEITEKIDISLKTTLSRIQSDLEEINSKIDDTKQELNNKLEANSDDQNEIKAELKGLEERIQKIEVANMAAVTETYASVTNNKASVLQTPLKSYFKQSSVRTSASTTSGNNYDIRNVMKEARKIVGLFPISKNDVE